MTKRESLIIVPMVRSFLDGVEKAEINAVKYIVHKCKNIYPAPKFVDRVRR